MPKSESHECDEKVRFLMSKASRGDSDAMNELIRNFTPFVTGVAYAITRNREGAEDVALETMVIWTRFFKIFANNRMLSCLLIKAWLRIVATRLAWVWVKKHPQSDEYDDEHQDGKESSPLTPAEIAHIRQRDKSLNECIDELSEPDARVLRIWMNDLKLEAIADFLIFAGDITRVQVFLRRAQSKVRACMAIKGYSIAEGW